MAELTDTKATDTAREASLSQDHEQSREQPQEEFVTFLDRCIGFILLVGPWSYMTARAQELLQGLLPVKIINMVVLAGIIVFLVAVGGLSKRIHRFRAAWRKEEPEQETVSPDDGQPSTLD